MLNQSSITQNHSWLCDRIINVPSWLIIAFLCSDAHNIIHHSFVIELTDKKKKKKNAMLKLYWMLLLFILNATISLFFYKCFFFYMDGLIRFTSSNTWKYKERYYLLLGKYGTNIKTNYSIPLVAMRFISDKFF